MEPFVIALSFWTAGTGLLLWVGYRWHKAEHLAPPAPPAPPNPSAANHHTARLTSWAVRRAAPGDIAHIAWPNDPSQERYLVPNLQVSVTVDDEVTIGIDPATLTWHDEGLFEWLEARFGQQ